MKDFSTFSICLPAGCNAHCRYCVSQMTGIDNCKTQDMDYRNFGKALRMAEIAQINTALFTGKGEPTLFPDKITRMLREMNNQFPLVVLQTNGLTLCDQIGKNDLKLLYNWYNLGLTHISLSVVHYNSIRNEDVICKKGQEHYNIAGLACALQKIGFIVRLNVTMCKGYIDDLAKVLEVIQWAEDKNVELTFRPVALSDNKKSETVYEWTKEHLIAPNEIENIKNYFDKNVRILYDFDFGARWYDFRGQNVVLSNCLTGYEKGKPIRQLILFPDFSLRFDWQAESAILLPASPKM